MSGGTYGPAHSGRTRVEVAVQTRAELGEGPTWDPAVGRLIWVDILGSRVHTYTPADGSRTVMATEQHVGAAKPRTGGGLVVNLRDGIGLYDADGTFSWLVHDPVPGRRGNDAAVAPDGSLWAGSMRYDEAPGGGRLIRVAPDGTATEQLTVGVGNGTGWSPDGRTMFYIDSLTRRIESFRVEDREEAKDGTDGLDGPDTGGRRISGRRTLAVIEEGAGIPDGLTVDADGCVWAALWDGGQIRRYTPSGTLDRTVDLPVRRPTSCAFGGPGLRDLYITSARVGIEHPHPLSGSLLVLRDAGQGLPATPFAG